MTAPFRITDTPIEPGVTLVEASAGTGKTWCLTGLVLRLLLEKQVDRIGRILLVTFTRAATAELRARIRARLQEGVAALTGGPAGDPLLASLADRHAGSGAAILERALRELDDLSVYTIHSYCQQVLQEHAFAAGVPFTVTLLEEDAPLLDQAARDFWRRRVVAGPALLAAVVHAERWGPRTFVQDWRALHRHPGTRVQPPPDDLGTVLRTVEGCRETLVRAWDRDRVKEVLTAQKFNKGKALWEGDDPATFLDRVAGFLGGTDLPGLTETRSLALPELLERCNKRSKARIDRLTAEPFFTACQQLDTAVAQVEHALRGAALAALDEALAAEKERQGVQVYDDLLTRLAAALARPESGPALARDLRERHPVALVDEFQDTDAVQYDIFRRIFAPDDRSPEEREPTLVLVGDPKQAIYGFRGADIFAYLEAAERADRRYTLDVNWRSTGPMVDAVNRLFGRHPEPFVYTAIPFHPVRPAAPEAQGPPWTQPALRWWYLPPRPGRKGEPERRSSRRARPELRRAVAAMCRRLLAGEEPLGDHPLQPGEIAVLVRSNREATLVEQALAALGVPAVVSRSGDVFASPEAVELQLLLHALAEPRHLRAVRALAATLLQGGDSCRVQALESGGPEAAKAVEEILDLRARWAERGFMAMADDLLRRWRVRVRLLRLLDGERRLTNYLHLLERIHQAILAGRLTPAGTDRWLERRRSGGGERDEDRELRLDRDGGAVQVVTMHKAKGLEYDVVFCPALWESTLPTGKEPFLVHRNPQEVVYCCDEDADLLRDHRAEELAGDIRLAYVALTRARKRCYVAWGALGSDVAGVRYGAPWSALGHLLHAPGPSSEDGPGARVEAERAVYADAWTEWEAELAAQVEASRGAMVVEPLPATPTPTPAAVPVAAEPVPRALTLRPVALRSWQVTSYSGLVRGGGGERPDHADPVGGGLMDPAAEEAAGDDPGGLHGFARGARAGNALHQILETYRFDRPEEPANMVLIRTVLAAHGLDEPGGHPGGVERPGEAVATALAALARSTPPGLTCTLGGCLGGAVTREWEFHLAAGEVDTRALPDLFREHYDGPLAEGYVRALGFLPDRIFYGYLKGYIDLLASDGERWLVVDWKSNHLGPGPAAYRPETLAAAMVEHHYILQYHLYLVALHRYLRLRLGGDYEYGKQVAGAGYHFLRGGPEAGWVHHRPSAACIMALDRWLEGGGP